MRKEREKTKREQESVRETASVRERERLKEMIQRLLGFKLGMTGRERNKIVSYRLRESEKERNQL